MGQEPSRGCPVTLACDLQNPNRRERGRPQSACELQSARALDSHMGCP